MPTALLLDQYGSLLWDAFGETPYLVGSVLRGPGWRDVDVRMILPDDEYERYGFPTWSRTHDCARWVASWRAAQLLEDPGGPVSITVVPGRIMHRVLFGT